jgi:hypothetical protein
VRKLYALLPVLVAACAYDCTIGGAPGDGGDAGAPDASTDAGAGGRDAGRDAGHDAGLDAGPDCALLLADLASAREAAKSCTLGMVGQCATSIVDECGCASYVREAPSAATTAFVAAVADVRAAGCAVTCGTCLVSLGACLLAGGTQAACTP